MMETARRLEQLVVRLLATGFAMKRNETAIASFTVVQSYDGK